MSIDQAFFTPATEKTKTQAEDPRHKTQGKKSSTVRHIPPFEKNSRKTLFPTHNTINLFERAECEINHFEPLYAIRNTCVRVLT